MTKYLFFIFLLITKTCYAQLDKDQSYNQSGIVIYHQEIAMREFVSTSDTLKFNRAKSIFSWNLYNREANTAAKIKERFPGAEVPEDISSASPMTGQVNFYDTTKDSLFSRKNMRQIRAIIYLREKKPQIKWNISDSTKKMGNYTVRKATTHFRGRDYTAWFTPEIPVAFGPWKLNGLPGLILQAYDKSGNINFSATDISFTNVGLIVPIQLNGKERRITLDEYKEIMKNFEREMKNATFKQVRSVVSKEEMANMKFNFPDIELMETFNDNDDQ